MLVSIVVPVYNAGPAVKDMLLRLTQQSYENIEIVVVDDGSTDDSLNWCKEAASNDSRISVFHTDNQGSGAARNYGISQATGEYVYFPDSDDIISLELVSKLVKAVHRTNADLIVFGFNVLNEAGKIIQIKTYEEDTIPATDIRMNYIDYLRPNGTRTIQGAPWNKFFKLSVIKNEGIKYPDLRRHQDEAFIARYVDRCSLVHFSSEVLYTYNSNSLQKTWDKYPNNYFDAVMGLYNDRKSNILRWNPNDSATQLAVEAEYICNTIKAMELTFSKKNGYTRVERMNAMGRISDYAALKDMKESIFLGRYQRKVLSKVSKGKIPYYLIKLKVFIEKIGFLAIVKRVERI